MRVRSSIVLAALVLCVSASPAAAEPAAAVVEGNVLWLFDTATPRTVTARPINGLGANESVRGMDTRPTTGELYISTVTTGSANNSAVHTYTLDPTTGSATFVGSFATALAGAGDVATGFDFNPVVDRVRYVNANDENARIDPITGGLAANDTDFNPPVATTAVAAAYDRNRSGATATTVYLIDRDSSSLSHLGGIDATPSPNSGGVTDIAPIGFPLTAGSEGGFDISPSGVGYAALTAASDDVTRLYTVSLPREATSTNVAAAIAPILDGSTQVRGLTILDDDRDADGVLTTADKCPAEANATTDGCPAPPPTPPAPPPTPPAPPPVSNPLPPATPALTLSVTGVSSRVNLATLRKSGLVVTATPNLASSLIVELRGTLKGTRLAAVNDIVLAEKSLRSAAGARKVRLKLSRANQRRLRKAAKLRVIVTATDALGRTTKVTRNVRIR